MGCLLLQCSSLVVFAIVVNILKPTLAVKSKLICEHKKETLSCPDGETIAITYANYGRKDSEPCPHSQRSDTNCVSANSLRILREDCQGKRSCQLEATNAKFGDPCVGTFKYLELRYECKKACAPNAEMTFNGGCRCKLGYFGDPYQEGCTKMCMCKARGDPHYETYDGKMIHFQGNCMYVMTRSTHPDCRLEVAVKNNHRSSRPVTITREVDFTYNGITLRLLPQRKLKVDGIETDPCNYVSSDGSISISCCGNVLRVVTNPCGSIVEWDGIHAVHVMIPKIYAEGDYFSGICGNCNGDPTDDMVTQFGRNVEGEENAYYKLGSSWQIEDTSDIKDQEVCTDEIIPLPPCARKTVLAAAATEKCGMINPKVDGPFKECLNEANIKSKEYDDCVFDYCLFSEEKPELMQQSICNMHNDLRQMCNDMGYNITWRDRNCPTECGENQQWFNVLSGCQPTCRRPNPKRCKLPPSSGCGCKPGYVLGALGKCVDAETGCGCTDGDKKYYPLGATFTTPDCRTIKKCRIHRKKSKIMTIKNLPPCSEFGFCTNDGGKYKCVCQDGMKGDGRNCTYDCSAEKKYVNKPCSSRQRKVKTCTVSGADRIVSIKLKEQLSKVDCKKGKTFRALRGRRRRNKFLVRNGCGGIFTIGYYKKADSCPGLCGTNAYFNKRQKKCKCRKGFYGDPQASCNRMCECRASGDPHYKTYDGQTIHFMGVCKYTMSRLLDEADPCYFNVEVKNERRNGKTHVSYTRLVDLKTHGVIIRLMKDRKVLINGNAISLPKKLDGNGNIVPGDFDDWRFYVFKAGKTHVKVVTKCGYTLLWDGKSSAVFMVPVRFAPKMEGLCGDCNKKQDDFRTKEGVDVSKRGKRKHALVGDSYQVPDDSDAAHTCTKYTPDPKDCTASQLKMARSDEFCGPFTFSNGSEAFWECLVDIGMEREELYKSCVIDVCNNADDMKAAKQVACSALTNAIELCAELSDQVTIQLAKFCGVNSEETTCRNDQIMTFDTSCPSTCLSEDDEALEACTPMLECQCKDGMFEENGKCVPKCGQFVDGVYVPVGGSYMSDDCSRMHSVNNNGQLVSKQLQCDVTYKKCRNRNCIIV